MQLCYSNSSSPKWTGESCSKNLLLLVFAVKYCLVSQHTCIIQVDVFFHIFKTYKNNELKDVKQLSVLRFIVSFVSAVYQ